MYRCSWLANLFLVFLIFEIFVSRSIMHRGGRGGGQQPLTKATMQFVHTFVNHLFITICYWIAIGSAKGSQYEPIGGLGGAGVVGARAWGVWGSGTRPEPAWFPPVSPGLEVDPIISPI